MKVFTYYTDGIDGLYDDKATSLGTAESQRRLLKVWERSWKQAGWEPVVLTEEDAREHPRFDFFYEHVAVKPSLWGREYTDACFLRWVAMAQVGGGMLTDYDNLAYSFPPRDPTPGEMHIFSDVPPVALRMGAVLGSAQHYLDMSEIFAAATASDADLKDGTLHQDDESLIQRMFAGTLAKPEWLKRVPGGGLFPEGAWKTAPMTHYAFAMKKAGFWPKYKYVEQLRPF